MSGYDLTNNTSVYTVTTSGQAHPAVKPYTSYHVRTDDDIYVSVNDEPDDNAFLLKGGTAAIFHVEPSETLYTRAVSGSGEVRITALASIEGHETSAGSTGGGGGGGEISGMVIVAGEDTDEPASTGNPLPVYLAGASGGLTINVDEADLAALGGVGDAAWTGTGNGTLIAISKAEYGKLEAIRAAVTGTLSFGLPTGASTAALQTSGNASLTAIANSVAGTLTVGLPTGASTAALQTSGNASLTAIANSVAGTLSVSLPSGAATSALQTTGNASLANIETAVTGVATAANQTTLNTAVGAIGDAAWSGTGNGTLVAIDKANYGKLEAIRAAVAGTLTVGLPTGASTAALQTSGNASLTSIASSVTGVSTAANQAILNTAFGAVSDAAWSGTGDSSLIAVEKASYTKLNAIAASVAGTLTVGLPSGASTSSLQTTGNTALSGANTARGSISDAAWSGTGDGSVIAIDKANYGKLEAIRAAVAGTLTVGLPTGASTAANQATLNTNFGAVADAAWSGTGDGSLIAISKAEYAKIEAVRALLAGTLTVGLPTGASTSALQTSGNASLTAIAASVAGTLTVGLPSGASTAANQSTGNTALSNANTARGTIADGAWSGTGDGSVIAIDKANYGKLEAIRALLAAPLAITTSGTVNVSANFNRPADTTGYAVGDLVANSTSAGSVVPLSLAAARIAAGSGSIRRGRLKKSGTSLTNATFRMHLYGASPTPANGDNSAFSTGESTYLGSIDIIMDRAFSDGCKGVGVPGQGADINFKLASGTTVYVLIEATSAYTPVSGETFTVELEVFQD